MLLQRLFLAAAGLGLAASQPTSAPPPAVLDAEIVQAASTIASHLSALNTLFEDLDVENPVEALSPVARKALKSASREISLFALHSTSADIISKALIGPDRQEMEDVLTRVPLQHVQDVFKSVDEEVVASIVAMADSTLAPGNVSALANVPLYRRGDGNDKGFLAMVGAAVGSVALPFLVLPLFML